MIRYEQMFDCEIIVKDASECVMEVFISENVYLIG